MFIYLPPGAIYSLVDRRFAAAMAHIEQLSRDKPVMPSIEMLARFCANTHIIICSLPKGSNHTLPGIGSNFHISIPSAHDGSAGQVEPLRNPLPNAMPANNEVLAHYSNDHLREILMQSRATSTNA